MLLLLLCLGTTLRVAGQQSARVIVYDEKGNPTRVDQELLVRFDYHLMNPLMVNDPSTVSGTLSQFITVEALSFVNGIVGFDMSAVPTYKLHPSRTIADSVVKTHTGDVVHLDQLWATVRLVLPAGIDEMNVDARFNRDGQPVVVFSHPNWVIQTTSVPDDGQYAGSQASLHPTATYPNAHINVEGAWDRATGNSAIRVGVFDSGILATHPDLQFGNASVVVAGQEFIYGGANQPFTDVSGHGTAVAGIIGAVRNNQIGIAGIAGGNGTSQGVSLVSCRIFAGQTGDLSDATSAIVAAVNTSALNMQVMNHSWSSELLTRQRPYRDFKALMDALRDAYNRDIIIVASSGNSGVEETRLPAHAKDNWVTTVAGSGDSPTIGGGLNVWAEPGYAFNSSANALVDVAAPARSTVVRTLSIGGTGYGSFNGTSAAAPHVTGVAALLMDRWKTVAPSQPNLYPEDVENILRLTANDIVASPASVGRDKFTGSGRINATAALATFDYGSTLIRDAVNVDASNSTITVVPMADSTFYVEGDQTAFNQALVTATVYKITTTVPSYYNGSDYLYSRWTRNKSAGRNTGFAGPIVPLNDPKITRATQLLVAEPGINIINGPGKANATLVGYAYRISSSTPVFYNPNDDMAGTTYGTTTCSANTGFPCAPFRWYPFNPFDGNARTMRYSTLLKCINCQFAPPRGAASGGLSVEGEGMYPNPAREQSTLLLTTAAPERVTVTLLNANGQAVQAVQGAERLSPGRARVRLQLNDLPTGLYFYRATTAEGVRQGKLMKVE